MIPVLFHIWGPLSIHTYGFMIAIAASATLYLMQKDMKLMKVIHHKNIFDIASIIIFAAIIGGRLLHIFEYPETIHSFFDCIDLTSAGFSLLGSIIAGTGSLILYGYIQKINIINMLDRFSIYMPLLYAISRIGCFFAGCCYGVETTYFWSIVYTNHNVFAPCFIHLHPTQLYSAFLGFLIFLIMYFLVDLVFKKPGQLVGSYFLLIGVERFFVDFFRAERVMVNEFFSTSQIISILFMIIGLSIFGVVTIFPKKNNECF